MSSLASNVRSRREALGYSQQELAKIAGVSQTTIDKIERGLTKKSRFVNYIALALRCGAEDLDPDLAGRDRSFEPAALRTAELIAKGIPTIQLFASEQEDVTSSSTDALDAGMFTLGNTPIDIIPAAPGAFEQESSFGVYISTSAMFPEFDEGDIAIINRRRPPITGVTCLFEARNEGYRLCTLGRLLKSETDDKWEVLHVGRQNSILLPKFEWPTVSRVVAKLYRL